MTDNPERQKNSEDTATEDVVEETPVENVSPNESGENSQSSGESEQLEEKDNSTPQEPLTPEEETEKWRNLAQRNQAELENFRKRMARDKMDAIQYSNLGLLEELLPIIDNFEMGLVAAKEESEESAIYQGMHMVHKQMQNFLTEHGVEPIEAVHKQFDPNLHEALEQRHDEQVPEGDVIQEIRRGYKCKDRLLRASNVVVSKGPEASPE